MKKMINYFNKIKLLWFNKKESLNILHDTILDNTRNFIFNEINKYDVEITSHNWDVFKHHFDVKYLNNYVLEFTINRTKLSSFKIKVDLNNETFTINHLYNSDIILVNEKKYSYNSLIEYNKILIEEYYNNYSYEEEFLSLRKNILFFSLNSKINVKDILKNINLDNQFIIKG